MNEEPLNILPSSLSHFHSSELLGCETNGLILFHAHGERHSCESSRPNTDPAMPSDYKLFIKHPTGDLATLTIPAFLIENRVELWKAAFQDATARVREEYKNVSSSALAPILYSDVEAKHKRYFNEYFELEGRAYTIVTQTEKTWIASLEDKKLAELGNGDRTDGIDQVVTSICQIADDEVDPLIKQAPIL